MKKPKKVKNRIANNQKLKKKKQKKTELFFFFSLNVNLLRKIAIKGNSRKRQQTKWHWTNFQTQYKIIPTMHPTRENNPNYIAKSTLNTSTWILKSISITVKHHHTQNYIEDTFL